MSQFRRLSDMKNTDYGKALIANLSCYLNEKKGQDGAKGDIIRIIISDDFSSLLRMRYSVRVYEVVGKTR